MKKLLAILLTLVCMSVPMSACTIKYPPPSASVGCVEFDVTDRLGNILDDGLVIRNEDGTQKFDFPKYGGRQLQYTEYELALPATEATVDQVLRSGVTVQVCNILQSEQEIVECKVFSVIWRMKDASGAPFTDMDITLLGIDFQGMSVADADAAIQKAKYKPNEAMTSDTLKVYDRGNYRMSLIPNGEEITAVSAQWVMNVTDETGQSTEDASTEATS